MITSPSLSLPLMSSEQPWLEQVKKVQHAHGSYNTKYIYYTEEVTESQAETGEGIVHTAAVITNTYMLNYVHCFSPSYTPGGSN